MSYSYGYSNHHKALVERDASVPTLIFYTLKCATKAHRTKNQLLSGSHQTNVVVAVLIAVEDVTTVDADVPRVVTIVGIGRRRPIPIVWRVVKSSDIDGRPLVFVTKAAATGICHKLTIRAH